MTHIALLHIPRYVHASDPPISISTLAAYLRHYGVRTETLDLNLEWYKALRGAPSAYEELDSWLMIKNQEAKLSEVASRIFGNVVGQPFEEGSTAQTIHDEVDVDTSGLSFPAWLVLDRIMEQAVDRIMKLEPWVIGISLFTYNSVRYCQLLLNYLKKAGYDGRIVLGGPGALPIRTALQKQVDLYVTAGGEYELLRYMTDLLDVDCPDEFPGSLYPDYTGYPWGEYLSANRSLRITGSKGCIRRCNFCDIYKQWPKYITRDGRDIANEMITQHQLLPTKPVKFFFTDSLINGNPIALKQMCTHLDKYRQAHGVRFQWEGQFIASSPKFFGDEQYELMKDSGCRRVSFGIESGSAAVRVAMNKKMRDADIDYCIEQLDRVGIEQVWLFIVGWPSETREDFMHTLRLMHQHREINARTPIQLGLGEYRPDQGTDWHIDNSERLDWTGQGWVWDGNPDNTPDERRLRLLFLERIAVSWGFIHRAQNSPFDGEASGKVTLNSLYYASKPDDDLLAFRDQLIGEFPDEFLRERF